MILSYLPLEEKLFDIYSKVISWALLSVQERDVSA